MLLATAIEVHEVPLSKIIGSADLRETDWEGAVGRDCDVAVCDGRRGVSQCQGSLTDAANLPE